MIGASLSSSALPSRRESVWITRSIWMVIALQRHRMSSCSRCAWMFGRSGGLTLGR